MNTAPARIYGLIGRPLEHSFSQRFFTEKFAKEGIAAAYLNFELETVDELERLLACQPLLRGLNVTMPYKQAVLPLLTAVSPDAERIGAVNVIDIRRDAQGQVSELVGHNTDIVGFTRSIAPMLQPWHKRALVLGTGGASKAVRLGLEKLGLEVTLVSRSPNPGVLAYGQLTPQVVETHQVIVNATPLGMYPCEDTYPAIPYELLTPRHLCYDLVYNPEQTEFLRRGAECGATIKNGLDMLQLQAQAAWEIWEE